MDPEIKIERDLSFGFYADLAIEKIKHAKLLYEEAMHNTSVTKIKKCQRDVIDSKYLFRELEEIASQAKTQILNLRKQDLS